MKDNLIFACGKYYGWYFGDDWWLIANWWKMDDKIYCMCRIILIDDWWLDWWSWLMIDDWW